MFRSAWQAGLGSHARRVFDLDYTFIKYRRSSWPHRNIGKFGERTRVYFYLALFPSVPFALCFLPIDLKTEEHSGFDNGKNDVSSDDIPATGHTEDPNSKIERNSSIEHNVKTYVNIPTYEAFTLTPQLTTSLPWSAWAFFKNSLPSSDIRSLLSSWTWPSSLTYLQNSVYSLILELGGGPGSLFAEIVDEAADSSIHPECEWDAEVRLGDSLCMNERAFLKERRRRMCSTFARLFDVAEDQLDERDLPVVAIAGSGGGYRATLNTIGSLMGAQQSGIWDCTTYIAGISGSCWALVAMYSGINGVPNPSTAAAHLKERMKISYFDNSTLDILTTSPTNKYLLSGILQKANAPGGSVSLTDIYGTLVSSRLFVPSDVTMLDPKVLSLHYVRRYVDDASFPLPIFTAIHHEIPQTLVQPLIETKKGQETSILPETYDNLRSEEEDIQRQASWLWFEFTPYEVGSDELGAWIPTWALGRRFERGRSIERIPELSFTIQAGIYASAFCATLNDYFKEMQPALTSLPSQLYSWLQQVITENDKDLRLIHPVMPDEVPSFVKGMAGKLRESSPSGIEDRETFGLMDAGAELNIPYYPLLRRDVDCIIALDASTDSQDLWFTRAEEYAAKRGLSRWPRGARWPAYMGSRGKGLEAQSFEGRSNDSTESATRTLAESQEKELSDQTNRQLDSQNADQSMTAAESSNLPGNTSTDTESRLSGCAIWIGSSKEDDLSTYLDKIEQQELLRRDGIAIVYIPLISNPSVSDFDPLSISTWRSQMDEQDSDQLLQISKANFMEGQDKIVTLLKAIWMRKRAVRLAMEGP